MEDLLRHSTRLHIVWWLSFVVLCLALSLMSSWREDIVNTEAGRSEFLTTLNASAYSLVAGFLFTYITYIAIMGGYRFVFIVVPHISLSDGFYEGCYRSALIQLPLSYLVCIEVFMEKKRLDELLRCVIVAATYVVSTFVTAIGVLTLSSGDMFSSTVYFSGVAFAVVAIRYRIWKEGV